MFNEYKEASNLVLTNKFFNCLKSKESWHFQIMRRFLALLYPKTVWKPYWSSCLNYVEKKCQNGRLNWIFANLCQ